MRLTNRLGLPSSIVAAVSRDSYSRGDAHISVTTLVGPARKRMLEIVHGDELTEDVSDRIFALFGQAVHAVLERSDPDGQTEERLFIERHGWRISGQYDRVLVTDQICQDYKVSSTYAVKDGAKPEWVAQLNLLKLLLEHDGQVINRLQAVVILRDWQKSKAQHAADYPQAPVLVLDVPVWPTEQTEAYIADRLRAHANAQHVLPLCTAEERWERPAKFALVKDGNSRATSLHDTYDQADLARTAEIASAIEKAAKRRKAPVTAEKPLKVPAFNIEERPAEQVRCESYCPARIKCEQANDLMRVTRINFAA
jgi:hypothetical protein